ncbi:uracil-DNA glycosylase family protein [Oceanicaulis sp.]|uniref:uracil-DNA glycosylase family protein n=1 Tax=Oceanicaulis sp. TaxID=1924941 RepID=UPI003D2C431F
MAEDFEQLKAQIRACRVCQPHLDHPVRPVVRGEASAVIRIIGQAPGTRVQLSGMPFTDPSGDRLRDWMGVSEAEFYDARAIAITPMGFCFPGLDAKGSDKPPRRECPPLWQDRAGAALGDVKLTLLVGAHAQRWHLGSGAAKTLTETVKQWRLHLPDYVALPHPSWRNTGWLKRNPWFENEVLPELKARVRKMLNSIN